MTEKVYFVRHISFFFFFLLNIVRHISSRVVYGNRNFLIPCIEFPAFGLYRYCWPKYENLDGFTSL